MAASPPNCALVVRPSESMVVVPMRPTAVGLRELPARSGIHRAERATVQRRRRVERRQRKHVGRIGECGGRPFRSSASVLLLGISTHPARLHRRQHSKARIGAAAVRSRSRRWLRWRHAATRLIRHHLLRAVGRRSPSRRDRRCAATRCDSRSCGPAPSSCSTSWPNDARRVRRQSVVRASACCHPPDRRRSAGIRSPHRRRTCSSGPSASSSSSAGHWPDAPAHTVSSAGLVTCVSQPFASSASCVVCPNGPTIAVGVPLPLRCDRGDVVVAVGHRDESSPAS